MRRPWTLLVAGGLVASALLGLSPAAHAEEPVDLAGAYVYDSTGTLSAADLSDIERAADELFDSRGVALFVVMVDRFDSPSDGPSWANETAIASALGGDDVLLALATSDRELAYSVGDDFALTNSRLDDVVDDHLVPSLRSSRWAEGVVAFAGGLDDALAPTPPWLWIILGALAVATGAWLLGRWWLRRHRAAKARRAEAEELDRREAEADALLVTLDDAVRTSRQELGFAVAQFGEDATAPFRTAIDEATAQLAAAFERQRTLDDSDPETPAERRTLIEQIVQLCGQADTTLDAQAQAFDDLRALEREAPRLREELVVAQPEVSGRIAAARAIEADLRARYGDAALSPVAGSLDQAAKLDAFAAIELQRATENLQSGATGVAAVGIRSAQQALGQIDTLLGSVTALADELSTAARNLTAARADLETDIAAAQRVGLDDASDAAELIAQARAAQAALDAAAALPPTAALTAVAEADATLTAASDRILGRAVERDRAVVQLDRVQAAAQSNIRLASQYIETRRGRIGSRARTGLATAESRFAASVAAAAHGAPIDALTSAMQASTEAERALALAREDVRRDDPLPPVHGDYRESAFSGGILDWLFGDSTDADRSYSGGDWGGGGSSRSGWSSSSRSSSSRRSSSSSRSSSRRSGGSSSRRSGGSSSRRSGGRRF